MITLDDTRLIDDCRFPNPPLEERSKEQLISLLEALVPHLNALNSYYMDVVIPRQSARKNRKWPDGLWDAYKSAYFAHVGETGSAPGWTSLGKAAYRHQSAQDKKKRLVASLFSEHRSKQFLSEMKTRAGLLANYPPSSEKIERYKAEVVNRASDPGD